MLHAVFIPVYIFTAYFVLDIHQEYLLRFLLTTIFIAISMILYLYWDLEKIRRKHFLLLGDVLIGKTGYRREMVDRSLITILKMPLRRNVDLAIRIGTGMIVFFLIFLFVFRYDFYRLIITETVFLFLATLWLLTGYFLTEKIVLNLVNQPDFVSKLLIPFANAGTFVKFKDSLNFIILTTLSLMFSVSAFWGLYLGEHQFKKSFRYELSLANYEMNYRLNELIRELQNTSEWMEKLLQESTGEDKSLKNNLKDAVEILMAKSSYGEYIKNYILFDVSTMQARFSLLDNQVITGNIFRTAEGKEKKYFYDNITRELYLFFDGGKHFFHVFVISLDLLHRNFGDKSYIFVLMDRDFHILYSNEEFFHGKNVMDFVKRKSDLKVLEKEIVLNYFYYNGIIYEFVMLQPDDIEENTLLFYGIFYDKYEVYKALYFLIILIGAILIFVGLMTTFMIYLIMKNKTARLVNLSNVLDKIANGDLRFSTFSYTNDEFGLISININKLCSSLNEIIAKINSIIDEIMKTSREFQKLSKEQLENSELESIAIEEMSSTIDEIATSMDNVSEFANEQDELIQNLHRNIKNLSEIVRETKASFVEIHQRIKKSYEFKEKSEKEIQNTIHSINEIQEVSKKVNYVVNIVKDISDQISLLSLNASIEAARAGELGKGFAVVAEEISKLSDKTIHSIREIRDFMNTTQNNISKVVQFSNYIRESMNSILQDLDYIYKSFQDTNEVMNRQEVVNSSVLTQMNSISHRSKEIRRSIHEKKVSMEEITKNIRSIFQIIFRSSKNSRFIHDTVIETKKELEELIHALQYFKLHSYPHKDGKDS